MRGLGNRGAATTNGDCTSVACTARESTSCPRTARGERNQNHEDHATRKRRGSQQHITMVWKCVGVAILKQTACTDDHGKTVEPRHNKRPKRVTATKMKRRCL